MFSDIPFDKMPERFPSRCWFLGGTDGVIATRGHAGSLIFTRKGQIVGVQTPTTDRFWHYRGSSAPRWMSTGLGGMSTGMGRNHRLPEEELRSLLEKLTDRAISEYLAMPTSSRLQYGDVEVNVLDSVCSGNCLLGTAKYTRQFMPEGYRPLREFLALPDLGWSEDRVRAAAFAIESWKQARRAVH